LELEVCIEGCRRCTVRIAEESSTAFTYQARIERDAHRPKPELEEAKRQADLAAEKHAAAQEANQTSDTYVLLTVLFASVLFFGGIAGTLESRQLRVIVLAIALALFAATVVLLATMPMCRE
jgi:hypothetical protein